MSVTMLGASGLLAGSAKAKSNFEPMEGLKGRDYGKERQKYVNAAYPRFS